CAIYETGRYW
nr:immunoglobulin heavy chain junction region [Homo sapiens]